MKNNRIGKAVLTAMACAAAATLVRMLMWSHGG